MSSDYPVTYRVTLLQGSANRLLGSVREIAGVDRFTAAGGTVALRHGLVKKADLSAWLADSDATIHRTVRIDQVRDGRVARSWRIVNARPVKYTGPVLNTTGNEVAIDELVLSADGVETA